MQITHLHDYMRRELHTLSRQRYMPNGWDRKSNQKAESMLCTLRRLLDARLASRSDRLVTFLTQFAVDTLCKQAARHQRLDKMVETYVELFYAQPQVDQESANALAELDCQAYSTSHLSDELASVLKQFDKLKEHADRVEVSLEPVASAIKDVQSELRRRASTLQAARDSLSI